MRSTSFVARTPAVLLVLLAWGCPDPETGKIDPYLTAHTVINQVSLSLPLAEGIFNQWLYQQTDKDKIKDAQLTFAKIKTSVANGLKLAHDGVDIAKQIDQDPDIKKLLAQADTAWRDLHKFLDDLLAPGDTKIVVAIRSGNSEIDAASYPAGTGAKHSAIKINPAPILALPLTLIPR